MKLGKFVMALALLIAAKQFSAAQQTTIRIPFGLDNFDVLTFDQSRVSVDDVKHWMKFSETGYYGTHGVSLSGCDESAAVRLANGVKQTGIVLDELDHETAYPPELAPVVLYLKRLIRFRLWLGEQYLQFAKTGTAPKSGYQNSDACRSADDGIRNEPDKKKACQRLGSEWTQCVLKEGLRQVGEYPKANWKEFLDAYGIKEKLELSSDNGG